jgi:accessory gene regulator B
MERLAKKIAKAIGVSLGKSDEEVAVVAYGLIGILQVLTIFLAVSAIGLSCSCWFEVIIVFLSVGFLRRLTGGAHSSDIYGCLIYSVFFVCTLSFLARFLTPQLPFAVNCAVGVAVFAFGYVMVALKAPVTPPNKPCRTEAKRKRLRKGAFLVLSVFFVLVVLSFVFGSMVPRLYSVGLALMLSTFWQIAMMTKCGQKFIAFFDGLFVRKNR